MLEFSSRQNRRQGPPAKKMGHRSKGGWGGGLGPPPVYGVSALDLYNHGLPLYPTAISAGVQYRDIFDPGAGLTTSTPGTNYWSAGAGASITAGYNTLPWVLFFTLVTTPSVFMQRNPGWTDTGDWTIASRGQVIGSFGYGGVFALMYYAGIGVSGGGLVTGRTIGYHSANWNTTGTVYVADGNGTTVATLGNWPQALSDTTMNTLVIRRRGNTLSYTTTKTGVVYEEVSPPTGGAHQLAVGSGPPTVPHSFRSNGMLIWNAYVDIATVKHYQSVYLPDLTTP